MNLEVTYENGVWRANGVEIEPIPEGYCPHGAYVGGCGIDWMCGPCEMSEGVNEYSEESLDVLSKLRGRKLADSIPSFFKAWEISCLYRVPIHDQDPNHWAAWLMSDDAIPGQMIRGLAQVYRLRKMRSALTDDPADEQWFGRAQSEVTSAARAAEAASDQPPRQYTEIDEIHEYGYVPEVG